VFASQVLLPLESLHQHYTFLVNVNVQLIYKK
jgi:hypothetical protein